MSIESIIGITSGLIAIVGAAISATHYLRKRMKECPTTELFNQFTQREISDAERRQIHTKLNKSSLIGKRIKDDYIQNFTLEKRGREAVLFDICDSNDIEPSAAVVKYSLTTEFLSNSLSFRILAICMLMFGFEVAKSSAICFVIYISKEGRKVRK